MERVGAGLDHEVIDAELDAADFQLFVNLRPEFEQRVEFDVAPQIEMRDRLLCFRETGRDCFAPAVVRDLFVVAVLVPGDDCVGSGATYNSPCSGQGRGL